MPITEILLIVVIVMLALLMAFVLSLYFRWRRDFGSFRALWDRYIEGPYGPYGEVRYRRFVYGTQFHELIERAERRNGINLSWAAREMIVVPVVEQLQEGRGVELGEVEASIDKIVKTMREDRSDSDLSRSGQHNAVSVIKAFYKRFCNIPPFCAPTDETSRGGRDDE